MQAVVRTSTSEEEDPGSQLEVRVENLDQRITGVPQMQHAGLSQQVRCFWRFT